MEDVKPTEVVELRVSYEDEVGVIRRHDFEQEVPVGFIREAFEDELARSTHNAGFHLEYEDGRKLWIPAHRVVLVERQPK